MSGHLEVSRSKDFTIAKIIKNIFLIKKHLRGGRRIKEGRLILFIFA